MNNIFDLAEIADKCLLNNEKVKPEIIKGIKNITSEGNYIGIAQINPIAGNIEYNAKKIAKYIKFANDIELDMIVFPELALMGYSIEDTIARHPIIVSENIKWLKGLAKITKNTTAIVGFVEFTGRKDGKLFYNSLGILNNGEIHGIIRKSLLPNYSEFNDYRYIEPSPVSGFQPASTLCSGSVDTYCNKLYKDCAITICEDCWNDEDFFERNLYKNNPIKELAKENPKLYINCSASPTRAKKEQLKHNMLSFLASKYATPFVYVNQVGAIDNLSYDGASRVYGKNGQLIARAKSFSEQFMIVNPYEEIGKIYPLTKGLDKSLTEQKIFTLEYESDLERTYKTIIQGIRDYFNKCGLSRAVLGLSGGLDSSVCAVLLADALGSENVFGISMPSYITSNESKSDAGKKFRNKFLRSIYPAND